MASSISFHVEVKNILPVPVIKKFRIVPWSIRNDKLCLIARRPLSNDALLELKALTGFQDYEIQIVGDDVIDEYTRGFENGSIFSETAA